MPGDTVELSPACYNAMEYSLYWRHDESRHQRLHTLHHNSRRNARQTIPQKPLLFLFSYFFYGARRTRTPPPLRLENVSETHLRHIRIRLGLAVCFFRRLQLATFAIQRIHLVSEFRVVMYC